MSESILTYDMNKKARFGDDYIFEEAALPTSTTSTSEVFQFGQVQSGIGLCVEASGDIDLAAAATLKIELLYDESETGSFANSVTLYEITAASDSSIQVAEALADEILSGLDEKISQSKTYTNSDATSAVVGATKTYTFAGQDWSKFLVVGETFVIANTALNNGTFTVVSFDYNVTTALATTIVVSEVCTNETFNGTDETLTLTAYNVNDDATSYIEKDSSLITLAGQDVSDFVTAAGTITIANTALNNGTFTVASILVGNVLYDTQKIVIYVPNESIKQFCKLKITTTTDLSAFALTAYTYLIPR